MHLRKTMLLFVLSLSFNAMAKMKALPKSAPVPKDNPMTKEKIELGKMLFFDPRLSKDGTISCNSCHNVMFHGGDGRPVGVGVHGQRGGRGSPTVWNSAFNSTQFWDGRAATLEEQAKGPLINDVEMGMGTHKFVIERLKQIPGYVSAFKKAFPKEKDSITIDTMAKAIATYERTLITPNSPFDKYVQGNKKAMSADAVKGMKLVEEIGCTSCHSGVNFSGEEKMGVGNFKPFPQIPGSKYDKMYDLLSDPGRFEVTKLDEDKNFWRVPTWRNVAINAPYFHNGQVKTLDEAVRVMAKTQLDLELKEEQVNQIVAFLNALTGEFPVQTMPRLPNTANTTVTPDK